MIYSEAAFAGPDINGNVFEANHCQHCADRDEMFRLKRKEDERKKAARYLKPLPILPASQQVIEGDYGVVVYLEDYKS